MYTNFIKADQAIYKKMIDGDNVESVSGMYG